MPGNHNVMLRALCALGTAALMFSPVAVAQQAKPTALKTSPKSIQGLAKGTAFRDCPYCPEMVVVPPGKVVPVMPEGVNLGPREVAVDQPIAVGKYEVTKGQFARFVKDSGYTVGNGCFVWMNGKYERNPEKNWRDPAFAQKDNEPVTCVNWDDAKAYTEWLSKVTGKTYRLPTEAEWEYAARAGVTALRPWTEKTTQACRYANIADATAKREVTGTDAWKFHDCDDKHARTAPVGRFAPNAFGLHDVLGNVWEWTAGCWGQGESGPPADGFESRTSRCTRAVLRGAAWVDSPDYVTFEFRFQINMDERDTYMGFRVVRTD